MNSVYKYLKNDSNNITRRLVNIKLGYQSPDCEEIQNNAVEMLTDLDSAMTRLTSRYGITKNDLKGIITQLLSDNSIILKRDNYESKRSKIII